MGEHADDILEGRVCQFCGEWFHDDVEPGHPRSCGCDGSPTVSAASSGKRRRKKRQRIKRSQRRRYALEDADTKGWHQFSEFHFMKRVKAGRLHWWPSTDKYALENKVISAEDAAALLKEVA